jgi:hypothetical protein
MASFLARKTDIFSRIDPQHIYVENIRAFFGLPYKFAKFLCDMAVADKYFQKCYGVKCPGCHRIVKSYSSLDLIPDEIECDICEGLENESFTYTKDQLNIVEYYRLIK